MVKLASSFLEMTRAAVSSWPDLKPWLNASDIAALVAKVVGRPRRVLHCCAAVAGCPSAARSASPFDRCCCCCCH